MADAEIVVDHVDVAQSAALAGIAVRSGAALIAQGIISAELIRYLRSDQRHTTA